MAKLATAILGGLLTISVTVRQSPNGIRRRAVTPLPIGVVMPVRCRRSMELAAPLFASLLGVGRNVLTLFV